jgi:hypothetical protein
MNERIVVRNGGRRLGYFAWYRWQRQRRFVLYSPEADTFPEPDRQSKHPLPRYGNGTSIHGLVIRRCCLRNACAIRRKFKVTVQYWLEICHRLGDRRHNPQRFSPRRCPRVMVHATVPDRSSIGVPTTDCDLRTHRRRTAN